MKIVVVNWNHSDVLRRNLANLQGEGLLDSVVVVDNGSTDDSVRVAQEYNVELMALPSNVGYGAANDIAMKSTSDDVALLLNSDAFPSKTTVVTLRDTLEARPSCAAVGPALVLPSGEFQPGGAGFGPGLASAASHFLGWGHVIPWFGHPLFIHQRRYSRCQSPVSVGWVAGACMMVRTKAYVSVGGFGAGFHMYGEDAAICHRFRMEGWNILYQPSVRVTHLFGASSEGPGDSRWLVSLYEWFRNTRGPAEARLFAEVALYGLGARRILTRDSERKRAYREWSDELARVAR